MDAYSLTDGFIINRIGNTIRRCRLERNVSQKALASTSGVSLSSIAALERGESVSLSTLIPVLRALNKLEMLLPLLEEPGISPIAYARMLDGQKTRKRASTQKDKGEEFTSEW